MSILIFLGVLFVLVLVHEFGHFIVAKKADMRVDEFGIGFPPKLFGKKMGETEYTFNLLPIGGFVKIFGEDSIGVEGSSESNRSFTSKSKWAQTAVLVAGVTMNVLFAWLLFALALSIGVQTVVSESEATNEAQLVVTGVLEDSPAARAGITTGMVITGAASDVQNLPGLTPTEFSVFTEAQSDSSFDLTYTSGGETEVTSLSPEQAVIEGQDDRYAVGISLALVEVVSRSIPAAIVESFVLTLTSIRDITVGISALLWDAVRLDADFSQVAGPVGIVGLVGEATAFGLTSLLMFTAFISLNLAVINLLPFPALDGGRLLFVIVEAIKGSPIRASYVQALNTVGFALLILLMLAVTYNDIARII